MGTPEEAVQEQRNAVLALAESFQYPTLKFTFSPDSVIVVQEGEESWKKAVAQTTPSLLGLYTQTLMYGKTIQEYHKREIRV